MTRIACIGEAMIELSTHQGGTHLGVAGDTLNTAIYLKRMAPELEVDYITCLGDDPFSTRVSDFIAAQNIGCDEIRTIPGKSPGLYAITTTPDGERSFTYWRSAAAARDTFQTDTGYDFSGLAKYDIIYLSGISLAILPQAVRLALIDWLATNDIRLAYDSNYRPRLWEDQATAQDITQQMWTRSNIAMPSIDDEMELFDETDAQVAARFAGYTGLGALKRGETGPLSLGEQVSQSYTPAANVIDTTAAGDSFNGGYLSAILTGKSQSDALLAGHNLAARVVQYRGAIMPDTA